MSEHNIDSKFVNHLTTYRFGGRTIKFVGNACAPYIKVSMSLAGQPINNVIHSADGILDNTLLTVDNYIPEFFKLPKEIQDNEPSIIEHHSGTNEPVDFGLTAPAAGVTKLQPVSESYYEIYVHQPIHEMLSSVRVSYSGIYDTKGKALIRGSFDPIITPLNNQLEPFVKTNFPKAKEVPKEGFSNEMSRTVRFFINAAVSLIPNNVTKAANHVGETYAENYINQNVNSVIAPVTAAVNTTRVLSGEVRQLATSAITPAVNNTE